jgi:hypothetical protein
VVDLPSPWKLDGSRLWPNTIIDDAPDKPQSALFRLTVHGLMLRKGLFDASIAIDWHANVLVVVVLHPHLADIHTKRGLYIPHGFEITILATSKIL